MEAHQHSLAQLFAQLGLPADGPAIDQFVANHAPLAETIVLADAPFWSASQASFLREQLARDADWADVVDDLNTRLHG